MGYLVNVDFKRPSVSFLEDGSVMVDKFSYEWISFPSGFNLNTTNKYPLYFLAAKNKSFGGYTVNPIYTTNKGRFKQNSNSIPVEVFGKVIYERITDYVETSKVDSTMEGGFVKGAQIVFNWKIESQLPPTRIFPKNQEPFNDGAAYRESRVWYDAMNQNNQYGWGGYHNSPIKDVTIRIRKLKGNKSTSGGWIGNISTDTNIADVSNPFDQTEYDEVARITIPANQLKVPDRNTLNDTNRDRPDSKGYSDENILIDTIEGSVYYITDRPSVNNVKRFGMILTETSYLKVSQIQGKIKLNINWNPGYDRFESGEHYYLTLQPVNHPIERMKTQGIYKSTFDDFADDPKDNPQLTPCDGWYGMERIWPWHYRNTGGGNFDGKAFDGLFEAQPYKLTSTDINFNKEGDLPDVYQQKSWIGLPVAEERTSNFEYRFSIITRFRLPNSVSHGSWNGTSINCKWKKPKDIISKLRDGNIYWSSNDRDILSEEFHTYGVNIGNNYSGNSFDVNTKRDDVDEKAEYFAWFKTPPNKVKVIVIDPPIAFVDSESRTYKLPNVSKGLDPKITNTNDFQTKNVTIYGKIYYDDLDFYLQSQFQSQVDYANSKNKSGDAQNIQSEIDKIKNKLKFPGNRPKSCGFILKEKTKNQEIKKTIFSNLDTYQFNSYVRNLPTDILTTEGKSSNNSSAGISISYSFDLKTEENWTYQIWVTNVDGNTYYADPNKNNIEAHNYPIVFGDIKLSSFPDPVANSFGFWYQVYNTWELFEIDKNNLNKRQLPYITKKKQPGDNRNYPVHYYMNHVFDQDINYQFRTTVEDFIRIKGDTNGTYLTSTSSSIYVSLPWGENVKMVAPYINTDLTNLTNDDKDKVRNLNIYMFSNINGYLLKNLKELDTLASADDVSSKPKSFIMSKSNPQNPITFSTNRDLSGVGLSYVGISKCNWTIQGFAPFNFLNQINKGLPNTTKGSEIIPLFINNEPYGGKGWHFLEKEGEFVWFDKLAPANNTPEIDVVSNLPIGGNVYDYYSDKSSNIKYLINNFISTYIQQEKFNLSFEYKNNSGFGLKIYTGSKLPYVSETDWFKTNIDELIETEQVNLLGELKNNNVVTSDGFQICEFYGVEGNQFIFFVADPVIDFNKSTKNGILTKDPDGYFLTNNIKGFGTYSVINIKNFKITSNYHVSNNLIHSVNGNFEKIIPDNATYSINLGIGNNVFVSDSSPVTYYSKSGNSTFYSGVWENGIWNNGWRTDKTKREFYNIGKFYSYDRDRIWRFTINGSKYSTSAFTVGDNVSIGNITAIDINDNRRLLKKFYKVVSVSDNQIEVEFETDFPLRRIEIDSINHRIILTKNIWLDGVFLNGYFNGVWNNGLFSGYPMITKMDESTWIDGIFNGGHFTSNKKSINFIGSNIKTYENNNWLSLKTQVPHGLTKDDVISITYSSTNTIGYLGTTIIQDVVDDLEIITGIVWQDEYTNNIKDGQILTLLSTGLIQNFEFHSNNVSKKTSLDSMISERVFSYNSWIDVNYSNQSAVNIGRPPTYTEQASNRIYSENNLYGYPTSDVLSSVSIFRDSYSLSKRKYFLGSKYKINSDYVGDVSSFEDYFDPTDTDKGKQLFSDRYGWEYVIPDFNVGIFPESQTYSNTGNLQFTITDKTYVTGLTTNDGLFIYGYATNSNNMDVSKTEFSNITDIIFSNDKYIITTDNTSPWNTKQDFKLGVTISSTMILSRTPEPVTNDTPLQGKELKISVTNNGGILDLLPNTEISNRVNGEPKSTVEKGRYTMVEFDLIDYQSATSSTEVIRDGNMTHPPIHFYNVNTVKRETKNSTGVSEIIEFKSSYLPIYKNVNHLTTFGKSKQEFFFNKKNLMMTINGVGRNGIYGLDVYIDNLKFYEVDMIPFFQYFKNPSGNIGNINNSVQIPIYGEAPEIEQSEDDVIDPNKNQITNTFVSQLVTYDVPIPMGINWEQDYAIYRTQDIDGEDTNALYSGL